MITSVYKSYVGSFIYFIVLVSPNNIHKGVMMNMNM